jgi:phenylpropionate dioxygenase-like ring-hydroxylating dioxygenase large terminal subunit
MTFAANKDAAWMYEALPIDAHSSEISLTLCLPEASFKLDDFEDRAQYYFKRLIAAVEEDIPALENQQAGLNSPASQQGRYHELLEPNVARFAFWYSQMMR